MGQALVRGWLEGGVVGHVTAVDPAGVAGFTGEAHVTLLSDAASLPAGYRPDITVVAVKPQYMDAALPPYRPVVARGGPVLSIVAGKGFASFAGHFGPETPVL